jgi:hypothetical protein
MILALVWLFMLNKFGGIEVRTNGDVGSVKFFQENKSGDVFTSTVKTLRGFTPSGVEFEITKLDEPVVHDPMGHINSGEYRLKIVGEGPPMVSVRMRVPYLADFARSGEDMTFYGEKTE